MDQLTQFYYDNAGYSYDPKTETPEQGRLRCAESLAAATRRVADQGIRFVWDIDPDIDSSEWTDEQPAWQTYHCTAINSEGESLACIGGVDFGRNGDPNTDSYARVVQAELAIECVT